MTKYLGIKLRNDTPTSDRWTVVLAFATGEGHSVILGYEIALLFRSILYIAVLIFVPDMMTEWFNKKLNDTEQQAKQQFQKKLGDTEQQAKQQIQSSEQYRLPGLTFIDDRARKTQQLESAVRETRKEGVQEIESVMHERREKMRDFLEKWKQFMGFCILFCIVADILVTILVQRRISRTAIYVTEGGIWGTSVKPSFPWSKAMSEFRLRHSQISSAEVVGNTKLIIHAGNARHKIYAMNAKEVLDVIMTQNEASYRVG